MKHSYLLLALLVAVVGCSKNPVSTVGQGSEKPALIVLPAQLHGQTYTQYSFKARVNGRAEGDVYLDWDFGPADAVGPRLHQPAGTNVRVVFSAPGAFNVNVKAFDNFTDTLIDSYTFTAQIDSLSRVVDLLPNSYDSSVLSLPSGAPANAVLFKASVNSNPTGFQYLFHVSGPGIDTFFFQQDSSLFVKFPQMGTFRVSVQVVDAQGKLFGSDSSDVHYSLRAPDLSALEQMRTFSIFVTGDTTSQKDTNGSTGTITPFYSKSFSIESDPTQALSWSGPSFEGMYINRGKTFSDFHAASRDHVSGSLSPDLRTLSTLSMSFLDSEYYGSGAGTNEGYRNWGGTAQGLVLVANSPNAVIYALRKDRLAQLIPDFFYTIGGDMSIYDARIEPTHADVQDFTAAGGSQKSPPEIFVIFSK